MAGTPSIPPSRGPGLGTPPGTQPKRFIGVHSVTLDEKGRITMPAVWRRIIGTTPLIILAVERRVDQNVRFLHLYPRPVWHRIFKALPTEEKKSYAAHSREARLDSQGRLLIPPEIRLPNFTPGQKTRIIGMANWLELWTETDYATIPLPQG
jgi:DNA-binding transcriptional regulator/RsmH inhibitor MraZ